MILVLVIAYFLHIPEKKSIENQGLQVGDIVKENIIIKKDTTIEDTQSTEKKRREAIEKVIPIYEHFSESRFQETSLKNLDNWFMYMREARIKYMSDIEKLEVIRGELETKFDLEIPDDEIETILKSNSLLKLDSARLKTFMSQIQKRHILATKEGARTSKEDTIKMVSKEGQSQIIKLDSLYDLQEAKDRINAFLKEQKIPSSLNRVMTPTLMEFLEVDISYSPKLTAEEENNAASGINPVLIKLKDGKVILRKGDEVGAEDLKIIELLAQHEETQKKKIPDFLLIIAIMSFLVFFFQRFFRHWSMGGLNREKLFLISGITLAISAMAYRISIFLFPLITKNWSVGIEIDMMMIYFAIPFGIGALIIAFIFDLQSAVIYSFVNSIISGIITGWNYKIVLYALIGNLAVSYGIEYYQRLKRSPILKATLFFLLPANILSIAFFTPLESNSIPQQLLLGVIIGAFSAFVSAIMASFIVPLWEVVFQLVTDLKLIELANLNLPIFREMLEKAPGTYHHSQMVASLSEAAAQELELSPLLLTAMALYHDIGKISNPQFFTENHSIYQSPHDKMQPRDSAKMIITHLTEGLERAKKLKLPEIVYSSISQHHGSKLVRFFYDKARKMSSIDTDEFDDTLFRYPGKKPQDIENGVIMLADQVEAASKTLASPTDEEIRNVIQHIIDSNIEENQFDECEGLTFKALNIIANSFYKKLSSIYHMRVSYPGFDFKEKDTSEHDQDTV
jgi:putative nucleotidyltransferase with HDIG domain